MSEVKTVRFAQVVARAGQPRQHLTWLPPDKDPALARAAKAHRLLTVHQELRGGKKDYGTVGLHAGARAQFLLFPRSLAAFAARRVIAIDYAALAGALSSSAPPRRSATRTPARPAPAKPAPARPAPAELPKKTPESPRSEIERALADIKARRPRSARLRLERWLRAHRDPAL